MRSCASRSTNSCRRSEEKLHGIVIYNGFLNNREPKFVSDFREAGRELGVSISGAASGAFLLSGEGHFRELQYWYPKITTSCVDYAQLSDRICELIELRLRDKISPPRKIEIPTLLLKAEQ